MWPCNDAYPCPYANWRRPSCAASIFTLAVSEKDHDALREEAKELMRQIQEKNIQVDNARKVSAPVLSIVPPGLAHHSA